jgi:hypothetical protein
MSNYSHEHPVSGGKIGEISLLYLTKVMYQQDDFHLILKSM